MNIPPWSYSSLNAFECPRRYHLTRVAKVVRESQTEETRWGNLVHKSLEDRVKSKTPLPEGMRQWEPIVAKLDTAKGRVFAETRFTLTRNLTPTQWSAQNAWCRGIIDAGVDAGRKALLLDWKTGKIKQDSDQLRLFAAIYMKARPYTEEVTTGFVWLKDNKLTKDTFTREHVPEIWEDFIARAARLEAAYKQNKWPARPSGLCRGWCPVGREHCEYWSPKQ